MKRKRNKEREEGTRRKEGWKVEDGRERRLGEDEKGEGERKESRGSGIKEG